MRCWSFKIKYNSGFAEKYQVDDDLLNMILEGIEKKKVSNEEKKAKKLKTNKASRKASISFEKSLTNCTTFIFSWGQFLWAHRAAASILLDIGRCE